jgi:hypothetical protein
VSTATDERVDLDVDLHIEPHCMWAHCAGAARWAQTNRPCVHTFPLCTPHRIASAEHWAAAQGAPPPTCTRCGAPVEDITWRPL